MSGLWPLFFVALGFVVGLEIGGLLNCSWWVGVVMPWRCGLECWGWGCLGVDMAVLAGF